MGGSNVLKNYAGCCQCTNLYNEPMMEAKPGVMTAGKEGEGSRYELRSLLEKQ